MNGFRKATRTATKLKLAIAGPSGSGKTLGALSLAKTLAGDGGTVAVVDTENGSASLYGDKFAFDVLDLTPPYTSARYIEAMEAAVEAGYTVLVVDSLSHQWNGEGGILPRKEEMDKRPSSNSYTNWATFTKEHTAFISRLLHLPVHVIVTLRSKQDYILETNDKGKQTPRKVGMAPVQRDGLEYEFSVVFDVGMDHRATASKDRTDLFGDGACDLIRGNAGRDLVRWLESGAPYVAPPTPDPVVKPVEELTVHGKPMTELTDDELTRYIAARSGESKNVARVTRARQILDERAANRSPDETMARVHAAIAADDSELPFK